MDHAFLADSLLGRTKKPPDIKSEHDKYIDKLATDYAETLCKEEGSSHLLISPKAKLEHYKEEFKSSIKLDDLKEDLAQAVATLVAEGEKHLEKEEWTNLQKELSLAARVAPSLSLKDNIPDNLYTALGMSSKGLQSIDSVARKLYKNQEYAKATTLNVLLVTLHGFEPTYWYSLGICYQDAKDYHKALLSYSSCNALDSKNIGAHLFAAECHLNLNDKKNAQCELEEGEKIAVEKSDQTSWQTLIAGLKQSLRV